MKGEAVSCAAILWAPHEERTAQIARRLNERIFRIIDEVYGDLSGDLTPGELACAVKVTKFIGQTAYDLSVGNDKRP